MDASDTKTHSPRRWIGLLTSLVVVVAGIDMFLGGLLFTHGHGSAASAQLVAPATTQTTTRVTTVGPVPGSARQPNGGVDLSQVPDFVPALSNGRVVGYISKSELFPPQKAASQQSGTNSQAPYVAPTAADEAAQNAALIKTVYGPDLVTVVGHMYPGVGFVPLGGTPGPSTVTTVTG